MPIVVEMQTLLPQVVILTLILPVRIPKQEVILADLTVADLTVADLTVADLTFRSYNVRLDWQLNY
jgi:hypothetical protein